MHIDRRIPCSDCRSKLLRHNMVTAGKMTAAAVMKEEEATADGEKRDAEATEKVQLKTTELHEDMMYEIFSWLPTKSIIKFKSCSKSMYEFTKDPYFVMKHTQNLTRQDDSAFFIQTVGWNYFKNEIHPLYGKESSSSSSSSSSHGIPTGFLKRLNEGNVRILCSRNGLLLCKVRGRMYTADVLDMIQDSYPIRRMNSKLELFICNPTTQTCSSIVKPQSLRQKPLHEVKFVLGANHDKGVHDDDDDEEYKLIVLEYYQTAASEYVVCKAYTPKEGVWKEREKSSFMGHKLYYQYLLSQNCILSYNFESGETRRVLVPREVVVNWSVKADIFKWDKAEGSNIDDICMVVMNYDDLLFNLWVLTDYKSSSWSKFLTLDLKELGLKKKSIIHGFAVLNGDSFVFTTNRHVYRYYLIGEGERKLERICRHRRPLYFSNVEFFSYSSTLCSC